MPIVDSTAPLPRSIALRRSRTSLAVGDLVEVFCYFEEWCQARILEQNEDADIWTVLFMADGNVEDVSENICPVQPYQVGEILHVSVDGRWVERELTSWEDGGASYSFRLLDGSDMSVHGFDGDELHSNLIWACRRDELHSSAAIDNPGFHTHRHLHRYTVCLLCHRPSTRDER